MSARPCSREKENENEKANEMRHKKSNWSFDMKINKNANHNTYKKEPNAIIDIFNIQHNYCGKCMNN